MANTRIKDISTAATTLNSDDFIAVDGSTAGTRKMAKADLISEISSGVSGTYLEESNNLSDVTSVPDAKGNLEVPDVGTAPNEVPLNGMLGDMAYQDSAAISVSKAEVESTTGTATTQALTVTDGSSTNFVVQEDGRVGVGTASPSAKLHLQDTGVDVGLSIDRTDAKKFNIYVDSGGNLITRDQGAGVSRVVVLGNGDVHYQTSSAELALYNDLTHGSISRAFVKCEGRSGTFNYGGDLVFKLRNDDYSISERARFTQNGLCFNGDTAAANALDAYEEGLWSATFTPATSGTITLAGSVNALRYTIVGRVAHIQGKVDVTAVSSPVGNYVKVSLPTAVGVPDINEESGSTAGSVVVIGAAGSMNDYTLLAVEGDDHLRIYKGTGSTPVATAADFNGNEEVYINATYIVA